MKLGLLTVTILVNLVEYDDRGNTILKKYYEKKAR